MSFTLLIRRFSITVNIPSMTAIAVLIMLCGQTVAYPAEKYEILGLPGSNWVNLSYDNDQISGSGAMGNVSQGIDWFALPGDIIVDTYVEYRHRSRTENKQYFDAEGPAVGLEFRKSIFSFGFAYYWEWFPVLRETSENKEIYIDWYYGWDFKKGGSSWFLGLPGSNWASLAYDANGLNGSGAMGYINQGVNWFKLPGDIIFNTFVEYRHRSRTKNKLYYDTGGPAVGVEFQKSYFSLGIDYYWERLPILAESSNRFQVYLTWYYWWDLKK